MPETLSSQARYEYLCKQLEREDTLYHARLNNCIVVNIALGAAAATQFDGADINLRRYLLLAACCVVGFLITRGIHHVNRVGGVHVSNLRRMFDDVERDSPSVFPKPYYRTPASSGRALFGKWTGIPAVFQALWAVTFVTVSIIHFGGIKM